MRIFPILTPEKPQNIKHLIFTHVWAIGSLTLSMVLSSALYWSSLVPPH